MRLFAGVPHPLGASWDGTGTNFAIFSAHAEKVELCLFDNDGRRERTRVALPERTDDIWHVHIDDVGPGTLYGYRVRGPYEPEQGFQFNPNKLLIDPYARQLTGHLALSDVHFGYRRSNPRHDLSFDRHDSAPSMPKAVVCDPVNPLASAPPAIAWEDMVIYEAHVKGLTQIYHDVPPEWRGRFRGLAAPTIIDHLKRLGVTTLELLPIHAFINDWHVVERGLSNYWGYNTLSFFAPDLRYGTTDALDDFRTTIARLHDAGIEVILDVVYNHTAEGDQLGPTLSFRGIDNTSYYWLDPGQPRYYQNLTGCGNALNLSHPHVLSMVTDSLRYWVEIGGVDGFRFDLATTLARTEHGFDRNAAFFAAIRNDPVLAGVKLIAEPWDIGPSGYRVGSFPPPWAEWNDQFRQTLRRYWRGEERLLGELGRRMTGSADLFDYGGRTPQASINHVTVHDGFTLADLVSYERKHNTANGEQNRDGSNDNHSTNCGVEGPTDDAQVISFRRRLRRNLLASLMLAKGIPLLLAGDEAGNSQRGNNNAYCQDNDIGWVEWSGLGRAGEDLTGFIAQLADLRRRFPQLRARRWLEGRRTDGSCDICWLAPEGSEEPDWKAPNGRFLSYVLEPNEPGGSPIYIVVNAAQEEIAITLPYRLERQRWKLLVNTALDERPEQEFAGGATFQAPAGSLLVFAAD